MRLNSQTDMRARYAIRPEWASQPQCKSPVAQVLVVVYTRFILLHNEGSEAPNSWPHNRHHW